MLLGLGDALRAGNGQESGGGRRVVLIAIEPRAYAQAIGTAIAGLRPHLDVRVIEPEYLDRRAREPGTGMVLCSHPRISPSAGGPRWVEYKPYAEAPEAEILIDGIATEWRKVTLGDLLEIVDLIALAKPA